MDPWKILGLNQGATPEEVRAAYRKAAAKHHPDVGGDGWAFQQVQDAYDQLAGRKKKTQDAKDQNKNEQPRQSNGNPQQGTSQRARQSQENANGKRKTKPQPDPKSTMNSGASKPRQTPRPKSSAVRWIVAFSFAVIGIAFVWIAWDRISAGRTAEVLAESPAASVPRTGEKDVKTANAGIQPGESVSKQAKRGMAHASIDGSVIGKLQVGQPVFTDDPDKVWSSIPAEFENCQFTSNSKYLGRVRVDVASPGNVYLLILDSWGTGGGPGDWEKELTTRAEFRMQGWHLLELQTPFQFKSGNSDVKSFEVWTKDFSKSSSFTLRTHKYTPPMVIFPEK